MSSSEQQHQVLEAAVIVFALVRRRGQQQERIAVFGQSNLLGQLVVLRLFGLAGAVIDGARAGGPRRR